ncbi:MAG: type II toxin-antitoxin system HigB family toxin [Campylobacterales bacterium]|nr:type II toxin-antitoxin system HigB family toxin [Campylobacterales bacterium]
MSPDFLIYRLIVKINYPYSTVYVRFVRTHAQYDKINAEEMQR